MVVVQRMLKHWLKIYAKFIKMDRAQFGRDARKYYDEHFDKKMFIDRLEDVLMLKSKKGICT